MRRNKKKVLVFGFFLTLTVLGGCGKEKKDGVRDLTVNFYKEEYDREMGHREEDLKIEDWCKSIVVQGITSSGTIHVEIVDKSAKDVKYEYDVDGTLSETIYLEEDQVEDQWVLCTDVNQDTEGSLQLLYQ